MKSLARRTRSRRAVGNGDASIRARQVANNFLCNERTPRSSCVCVAAGCVELYGDGVALLDQSAVDTRGITGRVLLGAFSKPGPASEEIFVDRPGC